MKYKIDVPGLKAAFRTAGALMLGNAFVAPLLFGNRDWKSIATLLGLGIVAIIITVVEKRS